jgi:hypothetical protein
MRSLLLLVISDDFNKLSMLERQHMVLKHIKPHVHQVEDFKLRALTFNEWMRERRGLYYDLAPLNHPEPEVRKHPEHIPT